MLLRWDIEQPGQFQLMATPMPTWDGIGYVDTVALPTVRTGDGIGPSWGNIPGDCAQTGCADPCSHCDAGSGQCEWCVFDHNSNGETDGFDFAFFSGCFGLCYAANDPCSVANYDGGPNNCVGGSDFGGLSACFGMSCAQCGLCAGGGSGGSGGGSGGTGATGDGSIANLTAAISLVASKKPSASDFADALPASSRSFGTGETFYLEMWAARTGITDGSANGLAAVYADITYDPALLNLEQTVPSQLFQTFSQGGGTAHSDGRRSVGGCAPLGDGSVGVDSPWVRVATVRMRVTGGGRTHLTVGPSPQPFGVSLFGRFGELDPSQIDFLGTDIVLGQTSVSPRDKGSRSDRPSRR